MRHFVLLFTTKIPIVIYEIHYDFLCGNLTFTIFIVIQIFCPEKYCKKSINIIYQDSRLLIVTVNCKNIHDSEIVGRLWLVEWWKSKEKLNGLLVKVQHQAFLFDFVLSRCLALTSIQFKSMIKILSADVYSTLVQRDFCSDVKFLGKRLNNHWIEWQWIKRKTIWKIGKHKKSVHGFVCFLHCLALAWFL